MDESVGLVVVFWPVLPEVSMRAADGPPRDDFDILSQLEADRQNQPSRAAWFKVCAMFGGIGGSESGPVCS